MYLDISVHIICLYFVFGLNSLYDEFLYEHLAFQLAASGYILRIKHGLVQKTLDFTGSK